jgi:peptidoglycan/LPS O-acetylase OafA/YrhL
MYMQMGWVAEHPDAPVWMHVLVNLGIIFMSIVLAYGLLKVYDEPVREWLKEHWLKKRSKAIQ